MRLLKSLRWYFFEEKSRYGIAIILLAMVALLNLLAPWLVGSVVDHIVNGTLTQSVLLQTLMILAVSGIVIYVLRFFWRSMLYSASFDLGKLLRMRLYQHWLLQPSHYFVQQGRGDLMARATNDIAAIEMSAGEAILALFDGVFIGIVVLCLMLFLDWPLALVVLLPMPLMAWGFVNINRALHAAFTDAQACFSSLNDKTLEFLGGIRLVRAYGLENLAKHQFHETAEQASQANLKVAYAEAKYEPVIFLAMGMSFFLALGMGAYRVNAGDMSIGDLTRFTLYLGMLVWPMFAYGWMLNLLERGAVAYDRVKHVLDTAPSITFKGREVPTPPLTLSWDISSFTFPGESQPVIQHFSGQLPMGNVQGIVGASGAGKSAFVQLLARLYESPSVDIRLNDILLADVHQQVLRRSMAFVLQDSFLFSTSIRENIALGCSDSRNPPSDQDVERAARLAAIHDDIEQFPDGYNTQVGERGVTLSGGQRQRIAIARVMLSQAPVIILDDALSAVDVATERTIINNLSKALAERTLIIVTHRLSALEQADDIVVMDAGEVSERGTHDQLIAFDGAYAQMHRYQQLRRVVEGDE